MLLPSRGAVVSQGLACSVCLIQLRDKSHVRFPLSSGLGDSGLLSQSPVSPLLASLLPRGAVEGRGVGVLRRVGDRALGRQQLCLARGSLLPDVLETVELKKR